MAYNEFTWSKVKQDFGLTAVEGVRFFPEIELYQPSNLLEKQVERSLPWTTATGNEKARSEGIINPILLEVRDILERKISVFSGEKFDVDASVALNGYCDFLISILGLPEIICWVPLRFTQPTATATLCIAHY